MRKEESKASPFAHEIRTLRADEIKLVSGGKGIQAQDNQGKVMGVNH